MFVIDLFGITNSVQLQSIANKFCSLSDCSSKEKQQCATLFQNKTFSDALSEFDRFFKNKIEYSFQNDPRAVKKEDIWDLFV
jgi:hypothetical protein